MATNFRNLFGFLVPSWLSNGDGGKVLYSLAILKDCYTQWARDALEMRFPSRAGTSALALIGQDRGIVQGRAEAPAHYAKRLKAWRYPRGHRTRGSAFALLEQVSEYFGGINCWTVDYNGNRHVRDPAGIQSFSYNYKWSWDTIVGQIYRFWIVIEPGAVMSPAPALGDPTLWGGAVGTPGYLIGQLGAVPDDVHAIRGLLGRGFRTTSLPGGQKWKPAGTLQQWLIVNLDGTTHTPDPTWANWSKNVGGTQVASRYAGWRYWALVDGINDYAGKPSNFPSAITLPDASTYAGNHANFPTSITLPDGTVYAGNKNNFPSTLQLVDDGGQP